MADPKLNQYIRSIIDGLKKSNYDIDAIKNSFNNSIQEQSKQNKTFLVFCYISSLLLGTLFSTIIILGSIFFGAHNFIYTISFIIFASKSTA